MKDQNLFHCALTTILIVCASCGNSTEQTPPVSESDIKKEEPTTESSGPKNYCCFKTAEDGQQFFPAATADVLLVTDQKPSAILTGCENEDGMSKFSLRYTINKHEYILRLSDYCSKPSRLEEEYVRNYEGMKKDCETFKELDPSSVVKGFYCENKKQKGLFLFAIVDGRFSVRIQGMEEATISEMLQLYALFPIEKLAKF